MPTKQLFIRDNLSSGVYISKALITGNPSPSSLRSRNISASTITFWGLPNQPWNARVYNPFSRFEASNKWPLHFFVAKRLGGTSLSSPTPAHWWNLKCQAGPTPNTQLWHAAHPSAATVHCIHVQIRFLVQRKRNCGSISLGTGRWWLMMIKVDGNGWTASRYYDG